MSVHVKYSPDILPWLGWLLSGPTTARLREAIQLTQNPFFLRRLLLALPPYTAAPRHFFAACGPSVPGQG